jgi:hypothetical protein
MKKIFKCSCRGVSCHNRLVAPSVVLRYVSLFVDNGTTEIELIFNKSQARSLGKLLLKLGGKGPK